MIIGFPEGTKGECVVCGVVFTPRYVNFDTHTCKIGNTYRQHFLCPNCREKRAICPKCGEYVVAEARKYVME